MSPSGGSTTVVLPLRTWSPENSRPSSSSTRHRWLAAWPGVWITRSVCVALVRRPLPSGPGARRPPARGRARSAPSARAVGAEGRPRIGGLRLAQRLQRRGAGRMVGMRMGADDHADVAAGGAPQAADVVGVVRARVDHDVAAWPRRPRCSCWCRGRSWRRGWARSGACTFFSSGTGCSLCQSSACTIWPSGQTSASSPKGDSCSM